MLPQRCADWAPGNCCSSRSCKHTAGHLLQAACRAYLPTLCLSAPCFPSALPALLLCARSFLSCSLAYLLCFPITLTALRLTSPRQWLPWPVRPTSAALVGCTLALGFTALHALINLPILQTLCLAHSSIQCKAGLLARKEVVLQLQIDRWYRDLWQLAAWRWAWESKTTQWTIAGWCTSAGYRDQANMDFFRQRLSSDWDRR